MNRDKEIQAAIDKLGLTKREIIDKAIERLKAGASTYSCVAISGACGFPCDWHENPIVQEYEAFVNVKPDWWESPQDHQAERIAMLEAFKETL